MAGVGASCSRRSRRRAALHTPFHLGSYAYDLTAVSLAELGDHFGGSTLLAGSAAFTLASGVGGMFGGPLTGAVIDGFCDTGLILTLAAGFGVLALLVSRLPLTR